MNKGHRYKIEATRRVSAPLYGPEAYYIDIHHKDFTFGKGKEFPSGKEALKAAKEYSINILDEANNIMIWRMNGNVGKGECFKKDEVKRFNCGWNGENDTTRS